MALRLHISSKLVALGGAAIIAIAALQPALRHPVGALADDGSAPAPSTVNCDVSTAALGIDSELQTMLNLLNNYLQAHGLGSVSFSLALQRAAVWKAGDMATYHYTAHDDSFRPWAERFTDCAYPYPQNNVYVAENLAAGHADAAATFQQWVTSPVHNENLLDPKMTVVGIGRGPSRDQYGYYWVMEFGSYNDSGSPS
jgi:uncharacterized protein YkwD